MDDIGRAPGFAHPPRRSALQTQRSPFARGGSSHRWRHHAASVAQCGAGGPDADDLRHARARFSDCGAHARAAESQRAVSGERLGRGRGSVQRDRQVHAFIGTGALQAGSRACESRSARRCRAALQGRREVRLAGDAGRAETRDGVRASRRSRRSVRRADESLRHGTDRAAAAPRYRQGHRRASRRRQVQDRRDRDRPQRKAVRARRQIPRARFLAR